MTKVKTIFVFFGSFLSIFIRFSHVTEMHYEIVFAIFTLTTNH